MAQDNTNSKTDEKSKQVKELKEKLFYKRLHSSKNTDIQKTNEFTKEYMSFINNYKIETELVEYIKKIAIKNDFLDIKNIQNKNNHKYYFTKDNKILGLIKINKNNQNKNNKLIVTHLDSPRLDLKPMPLYEDSNLAILKTHYYGGIKKYQWVNIPLELRGVIHSKNNQKQIQIKDTVFTISDLLPHLARDQVQKKMTEGIDAESLNVLVGNEIYDDEITDGVKLNILKLLNEKYDITERDLITSELRFVPNFESKIVGFDNSMIGGYGHDDRSCVYSALNAFLDSSDDSTYIKIALFVDKEEIGSFGYESADSSFFEDLLEKIKTVEDIKLSNRELINSFIAISGDVASCENPNYKESFDLKNSNKMDFGVVVEKTTAGGGKYYASESSLNYFSEYLNHLDKNKVIWQAGEMGKLDVGGGGTVSKYFAKLGIDIFDMGIAVLGMHSPFEIISKYDLYNCYLGYKVFYDTFEYKK